MVDSSSSFLRQRRKNPKSSYVLPRGLRAGLYAYLYMYVYIVGDVLGVTMFFAVAATGCVNRQHSKLSAVELNECGRDTFGLASSSRQCANTESDDDSSSYT